MQIEGQTRPARAGASQKAPSMERLVPQVLQLDNSTDNMHRSLMVAHSSEHIRLEERKVSIAAPVTAALSSIILPQS